MKIAVFGASGFVGLNVLDVLGKKYGMGSILASDIRKHPHIQCKFLEADLLNYDSVNNVIKNCDYVVHLAASPLPVSLNKPKENANINIIGSLNILDSAKENKVKKVIFSSASSIVGEVKYNPVDEEHPCRPKTPYGVSKFSMEHFLRVYKELYNLDYVIFRFFNVYGPWQYPTSGALIPMVYSRLRETGTFSVNGTGSQTRDFIYVEDIASIIGETLTKDVSNEVFNMGTGVGTSIKEIITLSAEILKITPKIEYLPPRPGEIDNFVANMDKMKNMLGMCPETDLESGLKKTFAWLESNT